MPPLPLSGLYEIEERCTVDKIMFKIAGFSGPVDQPQQTGH